MTATKVPLASLQTREPEIVATYWLRIAMSTIADCALNGAADDDRETIFYALARVKALMQDVGEDYVSGEMLEIADDLKFETGMGDELAEVVTVAYRQHGLPVELD